MTGNSNENSNNDIDSRPGSGLGLNHGMGRITGSASIETLVRVGIEKEHGLSPDSKMVVLHDFTPCVDDELEVKRGQIVNILYRENDWVYVIGQDTRQEGFIPHSYCAPYNTQLADMAIKKKLPRDQLLPNDLTDGIGISVSENASGGITGSGLNANAGSIASPELMLDDPTGIGGGGGAGSISNGLQSPLKHSQASLQSSEPDFIPFAKDPSGRYIVLYTFIARDENDVSVERGEFVTVLNREDPDWFWIVRSDGQEGFIPSGFVYPADNVFQGKPANGQQQQHQGHQQQQTQQLNGQTIVSNQNNGILNLQDNLTTALHCNTAANVNSQLNANSYNNQHQQQQQQQQNTAVGGGGGGQQMVMLYDYKAQAPDDLSVRRGDWIYADLNNQTVDGWLWAYAPKTRKYGFIPKAYARPPAMTSL
ncbi:SH3 domain-containing protein Dlish isoform X2 [Condylostylus longicornis]|uniref:SH3 domain-containing protein Dlish isoform X2 n=1 Tax=Condylostylus longicornis TaxID=2530218 RepID=UPI00244DFC46|nr:SH3 domain-containing protein Dlish isoform X2 [Condylostylus longicornis]